MKYNWYEEHPAYYYVHRGRRHYAGCAPNEELTRELLLWVCNNDPSKFTSVPMDKK